MNGKIDANVFQDPKRIQRNLEAAYEKKVSKVEKLWVFGEK